MKKLLYFLAINFCINTTAWSMNEPQLEQKTDVTELAKTLTNYIANHDPELVKQFLKQHLNPTILTTLSEEYENIPLIPLFVAIEEYLYSIKFLDWNDTTEIAKLLLAAPNADLSFLNKKGQTIFDLFFDPALEYLSGDETYDTFKNPQECFEFDEQKGQIAKLILQSPNFDLKKTTKSLEKLFMLQDKSPYIWELIKTALKNPTLKGNLISKRAMEGMLNDALHNHLEIFPLLHKRVNFGQTSSYPLYKVLINLIPNQEINKATAQAFLLSDKKKESQTLKEILFGNEKNQEILIEKGLQEKRFNNLLDIDIPQLELLKLAYKYTQDKNFKRAGRFIYDYLYNRATAPEIFGDTYSDILPFVPSQELPRLSKVTS